MDKILSNLKEMIEKSSDPYAVYLARVSVDLLSSAAPQVVADERKGSPYPDYDRGFSNGWDACAKRAAAPVQAQEPVAGKPCPYCGSTDGAHDKAYPHPRAPVQPVAVPDGKPFAHFVQPSGFGPFIECHPNQVGSFPAYRAAPAAQGDAIEGELTKIVKSGAEKDLPGFLEWIADRLVYVHSENNNVDYVQTLRTRAKQLRAAIAAKAES